MLIMKKFSLPIPKVLSSSKSLLSFLCSYFKDILMLISTISIKIIVLTHAFKKTSLYCMNAS